MPLRLVWKMMLINLLSLGLVILFIALAIHLLAADYFASLIQEYGVAPSKAHEMFLQAVHRYLAAASLFSLVLAVGLSWWLSHRTLAPLSNVLRCAGRISVGDYSVRVTDAACGELDQLARAFNRMADSLQRIEQLRKDLVINVAHEVRTPLTNIRGYMEGLLDKVVAPSDEVYRSIHEESLRLVHLVDELLQLARADAARSNLRVRPLSLDVLVRQTVELFQLKFAEKALSFTTGGTMPSLQVHGDPERLVQVITNLLENAWQYTPPEGRIRIDMQPAGVMARLSISNTIALDSIPDGDLLFERFYRHEKSRSREHGGAGIGLAIVKELIEAHGGTTGCRFAEGEATFWIELPDEQAARTAASP